MEGSAALLSGGGLAKRGEIATHVNEEVFTRDEFMLGEIEARAILTGNLNGGGEVLDVTF